MQVQVWVLLKVSLDCYQVKFLCWFLSPEVNKFRIRLTVSRKKSFFTPQTTDFVEIALKCSCYIAIKEPDGWPW